MTRPISVLKLVPDHLQDCDGDLSMGRYSCNWRWRGRLLFYYWSKMFALNCLQDVDFQNGNIPMFPSAGECHPRSLTTQREIETRQSQFNHHFLFQNFHMNIYLCQWSKSHTTKSFKRWDLIIICCKNEFFLPIILVQEIVFITFILIT